jgi:hypothetical protein
VERRKEEQQQSQEKSLQAYLNSASYELPEVRAGKGAV